MLSRSDDNNVDPLNIDQIRWFYEDCQIWIPFNGFDSIHLESKYRELRGKSKPKKNNVEAGDIVVVRGDMYEVSVNERKGYPLYWIAHKEDISVFNVMRGTWFYETTKLPLDSEYLSGHIEEEHYNLYKPIMRTRLTITQVMAQKITQQLGFKQHVLMIDEYEVEWTGPRNIYLTIPSMKQYLKNKLGLGHFGNRICRGYHETAKLSDKIPDITHVCFVIHGIGQKRSKGSINKNAAQLRRVCEKLKTKYFPRLDSINQRIEFLPVDWRQSLKLDGKTVECVTLLRNKGLRMLVNSSALDILYYTSPRYRHEIIESLTEELNRVYKLFCDRVPYFLKQSGKISIVAHSLGSVLIYDVLTGWSPAAIYEEMKLKKTKTRKQSVAFTKLNEAKELARNMEFEFMQQEEEQFKSLENHLVPFAVENLFLIGSPLAVFLALRGVKSHPNGKQQDIFPTTICKRVFNVFHSADPVVYRIEPLINDFYHYIDPVKIHRINNIKKPEYHTIRSKRIHKTAVDKKINNEFLRVHQGYLNSAEIRDSLIEDIDEDSKYSLEIHHQSVSISTETQKNKYNRKEKPKKGNLKLHDEDNETVYETAMSQDKDNHNKANFDPQVHEINRKPMLLKSMSSDCDTTDLVQLDLTQQEHQHESLVHRIDYRLPEDRSASAFVAVLTSHTGYWTNGEFCMFLMTQLFGHLGSAGYPL